MTEHTFRIYANDNRDKFATLVATKDTGYYIITALNHYHAGDRIKVTYDNILIFDGIADSGASHIALDILL